MNTKITPQDELWGKLFQFWLKDGRPVRLSTPFGTFLAIQDNGKLNFVKTEEIDRDRSSFDGVFH